MFQMIKIYDTNISVKYYKYIINWISSSKIFSKSKDQKSSEFKKKKTPVQSFSSALQLSRYFRATRTTILNLQVYPDGQMWVTFQKSSHTGVFENKTFLKDLPEVCILFVSLRQVYSTFFESVTSKSHISNIRD